MQLKADRRWQNTVLHLEFYAVIKICSSMTRSREGTKLAENLLSKRYVRSEEVGVQTSYLSCSCQLLHQAIEILLVVLERHPFFLMAAGQGVQGC